MQLIGIEPNGRPLGPILLEASVVPESLARPEFARVATDLTSLVGRERELAQLGELLKSARLVTLTGPGGVGKTRLAIRLAETLQAHYSDGVTFLDLGSAHELAFVKRSIANRWSGNSLLVLDTCEHLLPACAEFVSRLLGTSAHGTVLATSRESLGIAGERCWPVRPLGVPCALADPAEIAQSEAGRVFVECARRSEPRFTLDESNAPLVRGICRQLDGLPLALELAAGRIPLLGLPQVAAMLQHEPGVLGGGLRTRPARQQSLTASLDWSFDLLDEVERRLACRLAVFEDGWTLTAAEAVCSDRRFPTHSVLPVLRRLVDQSLVVAVSPAAGGRLRYRFAEPTRQYLHARLTATGKIDQVRERHLAWCIAIATRLAVDPFDDVAIDQLGCEAHNVHAALGWALDTGRIAHGLRLATACGPYWFRKGQYVEGEAWLTKLRAAAPSDLEPTLLAETALLLGGLASTLGALTSSMRELRLAYRLASACGDETIRLRALRWLGETHLLRGDYRRARMVLDAAARHFADRDGARVAGIRARLAVACLGMDDQATAETHARAALELAETIGHPWELARAWHAIGVLSVARGDLDDAVVTLTRSLEHARLAHMPQVRIDALLGLASVHLRRRELSAAGKLMRELLQTIDPRVLEPALARSADLVGELSTALARTGRRSRADDLAAVAPENGRTNGHAKDHEPPALHLVEAISQAIKPVSAPQGSAARLSARETEVAQLIGQNLTNRAIARELALSEGTVRVHVEHILNKLGLRSRVQVAQWLRQHAASGPA
jgi:predicted ATPase/DNA-binding CsgD family transcriptional regulator